MTMLHIIVVALIQGITEFLPISSSGHLILIPQLTGWQDQGLLVDVAVHVGTLAAILVYFFRDAWALLRGGVSLTGLTRAPAEKRRFLYILAGTVPAGVVGVAFTTLGVTDYLRSVELVAGTLIFYGIALYWADKVGAQTRRFEDMTLRDALIVGAAQALALIPGTSRSGVTMTAARLLGFSRVESARFSFLLSIPAVAGAGLLVGLDLADADIELQRDALIAGGLTFLAALGAMAVLMAWLRRASMAVFAIYRVALGLGLLWWVWS
jgi:undecaprenyl-diphosphatase